MAIIEFENLPSTNTPLSAENLNNNFNELNDKININNYAKITISSSTGNTTVKNASLVQLGTQTATLNVKKGNILLVFLSAKGIWNDNTGYSVQFNVQMDNVTNLTTGNMTISPAYYGQNWSTNGSNRNEMFHIGLFTNVEPGEHSFKIMWSSSNADVTAYLGQYSNVEVTIVEI